MILIFADEELFSIVIVETNFSMFRKLSLVMQEIEYDLSKHVSDSRYCLIF